MNNTRYPADILPNDQSSDSQSDPSKTAFRFPSEMLSSNSLDHVMSHVMNLTQNLLEMQETGGQCDVTLWCGDGMISAHSGEWAFCIQCAAYQYCSLVVPR